MAKATKTALVLSGGGSRGAYQVGAWQALSELGIKIDMVCGVSVGAINAAMVVQGDNILTGNLWRQMQTDNLFDVKEDAQMTDFALEFLKQGGAGTGGLQDLINTYLKEDEIRASDIDFGLLVTDVSTRTGEFLWKEDIPEGQIADFVTASASAYPLLQSYTIGEKTYIDGGYVSNMPITHAVEHGATKVYGIYLNAVGRFDEAKELSACDDITFIRPKLDLGDFLIFDPKNTNRLIRLGYLDTMKAMEVYDGDVYSFVKGEFDARSLKGADAAAKIFGLDPLILYKKMSFLNALVDSVLEAVAEVKEIPTGPIFTLDQIKALFRGANKRSATVILARELRKNPKDPVIGSRTAKRLFPDEIAAAKFLIKHGIL